MAVQGEDVYAIEIGYGLYSSDLPSAIPNGYCQEAYNVVGSGDSLENRVGFNYVEAVDYFIESSISFEHNAFVSCYNDDPAYPVLAWPDGNFICFIRGSARLKAGSFTGDGFMRVNPIFPATSVVYSVGNYGAVTYYCNSLGVYKITAFNWDADTTTGVQVSTAVNSLFGMTSFKDRMWAFKGTTLYFTNPATVTTLPETWSATTQALPVEGPGGSGEILKIIPIGSRMLIFTSNGLYALTVQGEPASWVFKTLDSRSLSTHRQCAFERNNLVYYVNSLGVYVTDGYEVTNLTSSISDKFLNLQLGSIRHSLNFLNDGMILSISKVIKSGGVLYYDVTDSEHYYTRLDTIAWSEWDIAKHWGTTPSALGPYKIASFVSTSDNIYSFLSPDPQSFMLLVVSNSTTAAPKNSVFELCTYDGNLNLLKRRTDAGAIELVGEEVSLKIRTAYTDLGQAWNQKNVKYAFAEIFTNSLFDFETWWVIDGTSEADKVSYMVIDDPAQGEGTNLAKLKAGFFTRRASISLTAYMGGVDTQLKFKNFVTIMHTERREFKDIR